MKILSPNIKTTLKIILWGARWRSGESTGGAVVRALSSHQCGPGSTSGVGAICLVSLLLVLSLA